MKHDVRKVELVVLSDIHLGTYGCHAIELLKYLKSIQPATLVLNGDIVDIWQFKKDYWPKSHMLVLRHFMDLVSKGVHVYYITGNHDEMLRRFNGMNIGKLRIRNKILLRRNGKKTWIFHGDVFDITMQYSKWLTRLGAKGYDLLILINRFVNFISESLGQGRVSLSKKIKDSVKSAVKYVNDFERTAAGIAIDNGYDFVVCGHIHQPAMREIETKNGKVTYLNSGDWIENLTALEYHRGKWRIYHYLEDEVAHAVKIGNDEKSDLDVNVLFKKLQAEFALLHQ